MSVAYNIQLFDAAGNWQEAITLYDQQDAMEQVYTGMVQTLPGSCFRKDILGLDCQADLVFHISLLQPAQKNANTKENIKIKSEDE